MEEIFGVKKPIIGMIHLAGKDPTERLAIALDELEIYEQEGVNGVIIENYHGTPEDVERFLKRSQRKFPNVVRGINILGDPYSGFKLARDYGANFLQFDSIQTRDLNLDLYERLRRENPTISVIGGVGFKYIPPTGNPLEKDLEEARPRCEAIVTTGSGTGRETPINKLVQYKKLLGDYPLIVGAGVNANNAREQLKITDGAIIGSYFKPLGNTFLPIDRERVREIMEIAKHIC